MLTQEIEPFNRHSINHLHDTGWVYNGDSFIFQLVTGR